MPPRRPLKKPKLIEARIIDVTRPEPLPELPKMMTVEEAWRHDLFALRAAIRLAVEDLSERSELRG